MEPTPNPSHRIRTFTWQDPLLGAQAGRSLSGHDYLLAMSRGELPAPPMLVALGFDPRVEVAPGVVTFFLEPQEYHYNPIGSVHGGVFATLLDSAMGCAVHSTLPAGVDYTSLELKERLTCARAVRPGKVVSQRLVIPLCSASGPSPGHRCCQWE